MERELRPTSREERLALLGQGRRCPGIPHNWRPPGLIGRLRPIPRAVKHDVLERDRHQCLCCGETRNLTVGHVHPRGDGGPIATYNLQTLCRACAGLKGSRCLDFRAPVVPSAAPQPLQPVSAGQELIAA